jgi:hypothetical protein
MEYMKTTIYEIETNSKIKKKETCVRKSVNSKRVTSLEIIK